MARWRDGEVPRCRGAGVPKQWHTGAMTLAPDDIDALYQVPLSEFTAARNALAKALGPAGADVKALEKPTLPAWAVNQVYWKNPEVWSALVEASTAMRQAHVSKISGLDADVPAAERAHQEAVRAALSAARGHMTAVGEKVTPATVEAITDTLGAIPTHEPAGRFTKPLKPLGLAALLTMAIPVQSAEAVTTRRSDAVKKAEEAVRLAKEAEADAERARDDARAAVTAAEREVDRARTQLVFLEKQAADARETLASRDRAATAATNARLQAEKTMRET